MSRKPKKNSPSDTEPSPPPPMIETFDPDQWLPDVATFPHLPKGQQRTVFVAGLPSSVASVFQEKGYLPVDVRTLPRNNPGDNDLAIRAWLQGMEEGTIQPSSEKRRTLELDAKANGLLIQRSLRIEAKVKAEGASLEAILERLAAPGRTLMPVSARQLKEAERAALIPGYKERKNGQ